MSRKNDEKNLGGMVPTDLAEAYADQARERGYRNKRGLAAAVKLWLQLPEVIQARLLNQSLDSNSFVELVQQIVDERIEAGRSAVKKSQSRPK